MVMFTRGDSVAMEGSGTESRKMNGPLVVLTCSRDKISFPLMQLFQLVLLILHVLQGEDNYTCGAKSRVKVMIGCIPSLTDLSGWNLRRMDSGNLHHFVGADNSCISWGRAEYGELGYDPNAQKSSAVPKKVDILDGMHVIGVACRQSHSMIIVDRTNVADRLEQLNVHDGKALGEVPEPESEAPSSKKTAKKGGAKASDSSKKREKEAKGSSESEDEDNEDEGDDADDDSDNNDGMVNGQSENKKGKGTQKAPPPARVKCGRGRPPSANKTPQPAKPKTGKRGRPRKS